MTNVVFKNMKINFSKLEKFGFEREESDYTYQTPIVDGQFLLKIKVFTDGQLKTKVIDSQTKDEYVLHLSSTASGEFVGRVSEEYKNTLDDIENKCYDNNVFKSQQAIDIIEYVNKTYDDQLEFLWKKFPQNAIWRRSDTNKWYGLLSVIPKTKLGLDSDEIVTVIDVRGDTNEINNLVDGVKYFPGYHMNKSHWYTMILDGSVNNDEIMDRLHSSYEIAK